MPEEPWFEFDSVTISSTEGGLEFRFAFSTRNRDGAQLVHERRWVTLEYDLDWALREIEEPFYMAQVTEELRGAWVTEAVDATFLIRRSAVAWLLEDPNTTELIAI